MQVEGEREGWREEGVKERRQRERERKVVSLSMISSRLLQRNPHPIEYTGKGW